MTMTPPVTAHASAYTRKTATEHHRWDDEEAASLPPSPLRIAKKKSTDSDAFV